MARALSVDLRRRVVGAIEGGLSYRAAAERFGVSPSSAIRWRAQEQREGDVTPKRQGGDRHSHGIEAHAELCLVPSFDGAFLSSDSKDALWDRFYTGAPRRQRRSVERYSIVKRA